MGSGLPTSDEFERGMTVKFKYQRVGDDSPTAASGTVVDTEGVPGRRPHVRAAVVDTGDRRLKLDFTGTVYRYEEDITRDDYDTVPQEGFVNDASLVDYTLS